jgi:hypothetical protein
MEHTQKPDFVFWRNGRVHLNRRGRQFSLLAPEVWASAVVMLDTPCSEVVWRVLATHSIRQFPLHFPIRASPCAITFQLDSISKAACIDTKTRSTSSAIHQATTRKLYRKYHLNIAEQSHFPSLQFNVIYVWRETPVRSCNNPVIIPYTVYFNFLVQLGCKREGGDFIKMSSSPWKNYCTFQQIYRPSAPTNSSSRATTGQSQRTETHTYLHTHLWQFPGCTSATLRLVLPYLSTKTMMNGTERRVLRPSFLLPACVSLLSYLRMITYLSESRFPFNHQYPFTILSAFFMKHP